MATPSKGGLQVPIFAFLAGSVLLVSFLRGQSVLDVLAGTETNPLDPGGTKRRTSSFAQKSNKESDSSSSVKGKTDTPKNVINTIVLPIARKNGINRTSTQNTASNLSHGPTVSGGRSDHQGPPSVAWAADMSNGSSPTPEMDALAAELAKTFGIPWNGSGLVSHNWNGYRVQLIYRADDHYDHVHIGFKKL